MSPRRSALRVLGALALLGTATSVGPGSRGREPLPVAVVEAPDRRLAISEVGPAATGGRPAFIELRNLSDGVVELAGFVLVTAPGVELLFNPGHGQVPPRGFVLVWLEDARGGVPCEVDATIIHGPGLLADAWRPSSGQALLRSPAGTPMSGVVWGDPVGERALAPGLASLCPAGWSVPLADSFGLYELGTHPEAGSTIGLQPGGRPGDAGGWTVYAPGDASPGAPNPPPRPGSFAVRDGAALDADRVSLAWRGRSTIRRYEFELATSPDFAPAAVVDRGVVDAPRYVAPRPLRPGTYFFHARAAAERSELDADHAAAGAFGPALRLVAAGVPCAASAVTLGMKHIEQRKDSPLLCLDGCGSERTVSSSEAWNVPHNPGRTHGSQYCARAAVAMAVSRYGASLSQDRIAFYTDEELCRSIPLPNGCEGHCGWREDLDAPEGDLAHDLGVYCPPDGDQCPPLTLALEWALGGKVDFVACTSGQSAGDDCAVVFEDITAWVDDGRPIVARLRLSHVVAISGYCRSQGEHWLLVHDSLDDEPGWREFDGSDYRGFWVAPPAAPAVRSDETWWFTDGDGDGVCAFDEEIRFRTNSGRADTDRDGVLDLNDIREYVFAPDGAWDRGRVCRVGSGPGSTVFVRGADVDGDSLRKELDADNDGDGCRDGVEDANGNGVFDGEFGESHNFIAADCRPGILPGGCRCR